MRKHKEIKNIIINKNMLIKQALIELDKGGEKIIFVVDDENKFYGVVSDGDIRRWVLSDGKLDEKVDKICNANPVFVNEDYDIEDVKKIVIDLRISAIPVVDKNKFISDILFWDAIFDSHGHKTFKTKLNNPVVVMAGGKGTRLAPFTHILPKPLIPIGDKAIIEIIIDKFFIEYGIKEYYLTLNHKSRIIKSFFEEIAPDYDVQYVLEEKPLGTAGSLHLMKGKFTEPIFITNCDIIIDCDYSDLLKFHIENLFDLTLVASMKHYKIPYGICEIEPGGTLKKMNEKPEYNYLVNTGMYVLNPNMIDLIPEGDFFDMNHFMEKIKANGGKIGVYPISENEWTDTGEWAEYKKAIEKLIH